MHSKIYGKKVLVPMNGLTMQDVPLRIYKNLIHIFLRNIMKHHKNGILGDYIRLVIHWVEDMVINVSYLLDTKLNITL